MFGPCLHVGDRFTTMLGPRRMLYVGDRACEIDRQQRRVVSEIGASIPYDVVVLANVATVTTIWGVRAPRTSQKVRVGVLGTATARVRTVQVHAS